jgi:SAM-dependent methyltransferase
MTDDPANDWADRLLARQYEAHPYPERDPRDEAKRLVVGSPGHLREIDYWVFAAGRPARAPLRALFAGGGTGDGAIMLAAQLRAAGRKGRVTWLDRSAAARRVAEARAAARGLDNIEFVEASLLDLPQLGKDLGLGVFDYVDCCGVLHHLPDPAEGLAALVSVLAPGGGLGLMVYAPHGRTGVYMLQDAMRLLAPDGEALGERLDATRRVLRHLPQSAWLRFNRGFADHITGGDAGLADLLLNPRDRAYTVPEFHALLAAAGLAVSAWMEPMRYDPDTYLPDARLRARAGRLDAVGRAALAEALCGNMGVHVVYAHRASEARVMADAGDAAAVPVAREMPGEELARAILPDGTLSFLFDGLRAPVALPAQAAAILRLVDGVRSVGAIGEVLAGRGIAAPVFARAWRETFGRLVAVNRLLLAPPA